MNLDRIGLLLQIEEKIRSHGPKLKPIHSAVMAELEQHASGDAPVESEVPDAPKPVPEAEAKPATKVWDEPFIPSVPNPESQAEADKEVKDDFARRAL